MSIEFRVQGKDKDIVAEELAAHLKSMFGSDVTIRKPLPPASKGPVRGVVEGAILLGHILITVYSAYETFVRQPREKAVDKWRKLVFFAMEKGPDNLIDAIIGTHDIPLHKADPEKLYKLTRNALESAVVKPQ